MEAWVETTKNLASKDEAEENEMQALRKMIKG